MPQEKKDDLLRRRREANASKKKNIPPSASDSAPNSGITNRKRLASTPQTPLPPAGTVLSIPVTSVHSASNQSTDLLSSDALAVAPLESDQHASSSVAASSIPSGFRQGQQRISRKPILPRLARIPDHSLILPDSPNCQYCGAIRFHLEPPNFCCSRGEVSLVTAAMPYDLRCLFIGDDEECDHFRKNARTYNNNVSFTTFAAKYDPELTKNKHGVYTFRVQGQVYHFLDGLVSHRHKPSGIQLYFFDTDEELARRLDASSRLRAGTLKLLMRILAGNPYAKFFKDLRHVPDLERHRIVLNCNPALDQRLYNLPSASQVAAIWTETDDESVDKSVHIQVYSHSDQSHMIKHYYACYDSLQCPLLFPRGESGWHHGIQRITCENRKRSRPVCEADIAIDPASIGSPSDLINLEQRGKYKLSFLEAWSYFSNILSISPCC
nr:uncharacterized protein LOC113716755 isoform X4 [Coffea arabica]